MRTFDRRVKEGLCGECAGPLDSTSTSTRCRVCADEHNEAERLRCEARIERGVCLRGKCAAHVVDGKRMCVEHARYASDAVIRSKKRRVAPPLNLG